MLPGPAPAIRSHGRKQRRHGGMSTMRIFTEAHSRRTVLKQAGIAGLSLLSSSALAEDTIDLKLPGGVGERPLTTAFPGKGDMILQRTRPPLLETRFETFDHDIMTPNDLFYVRWHWSNIPSRIDAEAFRLNVHGPINSSLSLSPRDLLAMPAVDLVAVNQCSGNSRGFFQPRVPGGQWANGSMGNARWTGVRLKDVLDRAGVKSDAVQVRFNGLDEQVLPDGPDFMKALAIDHARPGEGIIAYGLHVEQARRLTGVPPRLALPASD